MLLDVEERDSPLVVDLRVQFCQWEEISLEMLLIVVEVFFFLLLKVEMMMSLLWMNCVDDGVVVVGFE